MKLHLDNNIVEGTPKELVEYLKLVKTEGSNPLFKFSHTHESTEGSTGEVKTVSTELKVGDRVKVLVSNYGAEGEAIITKVLEDGYVELAGKNKYGKYSPNWTNRIPNLEKIEEDKPMGYTYWYLCDVERNKYVVLKATLDGGFETSLGGKYILKEVSGLIKPIDNEDASVEFDYAKGKGVLLSYYPTVDLFDTSY